MLRLILGRAKSGKTAAVMEEIRARVNTGEEGTVLLVPEQYSHEAETELLRVCGDGLSLGAEVLSFTRLAARVEAEQGRGGRRALDKGGRLLCLVRALDAVGSRLRVFGGARRQTALQQSLLAAIDECKSGCVSPEDLRRLEAEGTLGEKLSDLALVYEAFDAVAARSGLDPMDRLTLLAEMIGDSSYARATYYVDGFTDFTAQERKVLEALLHAGADVAVCLTAPGLDEDHEIFEPSRRAAALLRERAIALGAGCQVLYHRGEDKDGPMAFLETELFAFGPAAFDAKGRIRLARAGTVAEECEAAAARCVELVRETGCRWRDIAIAARNFETYRGPLERMAARYGVPLYTAQRSELLSKPLPALIAGAYAAVTGGWEYNDVFAYLKTGLAGLDAAETDRLENYAFLWSLHGAAFSRDADWTLHPEGFALDFDEESTALLAEINALRRRALSPLWLLARESAAAPDALGQSRALSAFFDALDLPVLLRQRALQLRELGMVQEAGEYAQLWELTVNALEQCAAVLGDAEMDPETFGKLLGAVLSAYDVGTIPLSLDRVTAGDMGRMRRRHIRHLFVLGCDSDTLPKAEPETGIFTDEDREALRAAGAELGNTAGERLDREFALLYNCLTLPSDSLTMSWSAAMADGSPALPAFVVTRAAEIFSLEALPVSLSLCRTAAPAPAYSLAAGAAQPGCAPENTAARRYFIETGRAGDLNRLDAAAHQGRGMLSRAGVRALYGEKLRLSATRADRLASCRFAYFLQYGLRAKPRQSAQFSPPELGSFMHYVLEGVAREVSENGGFAAAEEAAVNALSAKYVDRYVHERLWDFRQRSERFIYLFRRLTRQVRAIVWDMVRELGRGEFVPLDFELNFGDRSALPPIALGEGDEAISLTGVADRVDGWMHGGKLYLRVSDYKTGWKVFSLSDVWYGMGLQMLLYLFSLAKVGKERYGSEIVPAGVLYVPARDVLLGGRPNMTAEEIAAEKAKALRRSGLLLDDPEVLNAMEHTDAKEPCYLPVKFKNGLPTGDAVASLERFGLLSRHVETTLRSLARLLRGGSVAADPWFRSATDNACLRCDYAGACHWNDETDRVRLLEKLSAGAVWDALEEGGAEA